MPQKPKHRHRTPSEQMSRAGIRDYSPAQVRKALDALMTTAKNPLSGYEVGRLLLTEVIDTDQVIAANRFADLYGAWSRVHGLPPSTPPAMVLLAVRGSSGPEIDDAKAAAIKAAYWAAYEALTVAGGDRLHEAVFDVVIRDIAAVTVAQKDAIKLGLSTLANHWATGRKRAA